MSSPSGVCNPSAGAVAPGGLVGNTIDCIGHFPGGNALFKMALQCLPCGKGIGAIAHFILAEGALVAVAILEGVGAAGLLAGGHRTCIAVAIGISDGAAAGQFACLSQVTGIGEGDGLGRLGGIRAGEGQTGLIDTVCHGDGSVKAVAHHMVGCPVLEGIA